MRGSNPLFVDSTKFSGDGIRTQFELSGVLPYEDEKVFAKVTNRDGHSQLVPLHPNAEGLFLGSIYLKHQEEITYHFYIKADDLEVYKSPEKRERAGYMIVSEWEPVEGQETFKAKREELEQEIGSEEPLPEFEAQKKSLMSAVEAMESFFAEP